jgi:predicted NBD/HSP70 family sugar kinase
MSNDIGGSGLKAMLLDPAGKPVSGRHRVLTPEAVLAGLDELHKLMGDFDYVEVGFPGVVKQGAAFEDMRGTVRYCTPPAHRPKAESLGHTITGCA